APQANYGAAFALLALGSLSFIGVGIMTSVLPLISPEKGAQLGFVAQGMMLVVSGVYYPVSVMPHWMQFISKLSPATYVIRGDRAAIVSGTSMQWADVWPLLLIAVASIPLGLAIFKRGERYAKKHGKLKRSG
ncbi:MAG TPA: ABC transporter permease, partial [Gaiellaceae bacterium]|nr:ABC transporter permease [Gaiellaceae bacterium]